jgi:hypothetical protein
MITVVIVEYNQLGTTFGSRFELLSASWILSIMGAFVDPTIDIVALSITRYQD